MNVTETNRKTLFEIEVDLLHLDELLLESEGEITPAIEIELAKVEADLRGKADSYAAIIRKHEADAVVCQAEIDRLNKRKTVRENTVRRLKETFKAFMEKRGLPKVETHKNTFAIQKNGGAIPLNGEGVDGLPDECVIIRRDPDRKAIAEKLTAGVELPGWSLGERGTHLRLR